MNEGVISSFVKSWSTMAADQNPHLAKQDLETLVSGDFFVKKYFFSISLLYS